MTKRRNWAFQGLLVLGSLSFISAKGCVFDGDSGAPLSGMTGRLVQRLLAELSRSCDARDAQAGLGRVSCTVSIDHGLQLGGGVA